MTTRTRRASEAFDENPSKRRRVKEDDDDRNVPDFPLMVLLKSGFFVGSSLSIVNREASAHTRNLAQYAFQKNHSILTEALSPPSLLFFKVF